MSVHLSWYVARASGIVAWALLSLSVLWGVVLSTRLLGRRATPAWLLDLHRFLGGSALAFVGIHLLGLVGDGYVHFGWSELFAPLASTWQPVAVAWGIVAMYLLVAVELTSLVRPRLPHGLWKGVHTLSFVLFVVATVHILQAGTDTDDGWALYPVLAVTMVVAFLSVARAAGAGRRRPAPTG